MPHVRPPEPRRVTVDGKVARAVSLWALLDAIGVRTEGIDPVHIGNARVLLTQRFGVFPDQIWDALIADLTARGWSTPRFLWVTRQVLRRPYRVWNAADFDDPAYDLLLYDHGWVQLELERNKAAMSRMRGYRVLGYDGVWYRWADDTELPGNVAELVWDQGEYVGEAPEPLPSEHALLDVAAGAEPYDRAMMKLMASDVAEAIRASSEMEELRRQCINLNRHISRMETMGRAGMSAGMVKAELLAHESLRTAISTTLTDLMALKGAEVAHELGTMPRPPAKTYNAKWFFKIPTSGSPEEVAPWSIVERVRRRLDDTLKATTPTYAAVLAAAGSAVIPAASTAIVPSMLLMDEIRLTIQALSRVLSETWHKEAKMRPGLSHQKVSWSFRVPTGAMFPWKVLEERVGALSAVLAELERVPPVPVASAVSVAPTADIPELKLLHQRMAEAEADAWREAEARKAAEALSNELVRDVMSYFDAVLVVAKDILDGQLDQESAGNLLQTATSKQSDLTRTRAAETNLRLDEIDREYQARTALLVKQAEAAEHRTRMAQLRADLKDLEIKQLRHSLIASTNIQTTQEEHLRKLDELVGVLINGTKRVGTLIADGSAPMAELLTASMIRDHSRWRENLSDSITSSVEEIRKESAETIAAISVREAELNAKIHETMQAAQAASTKEAFAREAATEGTSDAPAGN